MMRARLTYVPLEVAEQFEDFIIKRDETDFRCRKGKNKGLQYLVIIETIVSAKKKSYDIF